MVHAGPTRCARRSEGDNVTVYFDHKSGEKEIARTMRAIWIGILLLVLAPGSTSQAGVILNGGFEAGLTSWASTGDASIQGPSIGQAPTQGALQAFLTTSSILGDAHNF